MARKGIGNLKIGLGIDLTGLVRGLRRSSFLLNRQAAKFKAIGSSMSSAITLPLALIGGASVKMAADLEANFGKINNLVGASAEELALYKKGVAAISSETATSQAELSKALFDITSAGIKGQDALATLQQTARAAAIGLGETQVVASAVTSAMNAWGKEGLTAARATAILANTVKFGKTEAESLAPAIGKVLPLASAMGVTFEEVGANIATFTRVGISSKEAVTSLQSLLGGFAGAPAEKQKAALASISLSMGDLQKSIKEDGLLETLKMLKERTNGNVEVLSEIVPNIRALSNALGTVVRQGESYEDGLKGIQNGNNIIKDGFGEVSKEASFQFKALKVQFQNIGIAIGTIIIPPLLKVLGVVSNLIGKFQALSSEQKNNVLKFAALAAAAGPVIFAIGSVLKLLSVFKLALSGIIKRAAKMWLTLSLPVTLVIAAIAAVGVSIYKNWKTASVYLLKGINYMIGLYNESVYVRGVVAVIKNVFMGIWTILKGVFNIVTSIGGVLFDIITGDWDKIGDIISDGLKQVKDDAIAIGKELGDQLLEGAKDTFVPKEVIKWDQETLAKNLTDPLKNGIEGLKGQWVELIGFINGSSVGGGPAADIAESVAATAPKKVFLEIPRANNKNPFQTELASTSSWTVEAQNKRTTALEKYNQMLSAVQSTIKGGLTDAVSGMGEDFGAIMENWEGFGQGVKKIGLSLLGTIGGVMVKLGKIIIAGAIALEGISTAITNFGSSNPLVALAAGVALVAVGSAITKRVQNVNSAASSAPRLAKGGVLSSEQLFVGGEYPNAQRNPEIVAPQSIMAETFRKVLGQNGGGSGVGVLHMDTIRFGLSRDNLRIT